MTTMLGETVTSYKRDTGRTVEGCYKLAKEAGVMAFEMGIRSYAGQCIAVSLLTPACSEYQIDQDLTTCPGGSTFYPMQTMFASQLYFMAPVGCD